MTLYTAEETNYRRAPCFFNYHSLGLTVFKLLWFMPLTFWLCLFIQTLGKYASHLPTNIAGTFLVVFLLATFPLCSKTWHVSFSFPFAFSYPGVLVVCFHFFSGIFRMKTIIYSIVIGYLSSLLANTFQYSNRISPNLDCSVFLIDGIAINLPTISFLSADCADMSLIDMCYVLMRFL